MKIKNLFFGMLAFAGMLAVASCSQDDFVGGETAGDYVDATFTVSTPDGIGTRAIGDGTTVNRVKCCVYDAKGVKMNLDQNLAIVGKEAQYNVRLAKGQAYDVVFFAYNGNEDGTSAYYDVTDLKNIEVLGNQSSNVEKRDAFTRACHVSANETMNRVEKIVVLKRPLAQLNLGIDATELADAANAGIVISKSYIKVSNVYSFYNAYDSTVVGEATAVEFAMNAIPTEPLKVTIDGVEKEYNYLAMNYLLVGDLGSEKTLTDVEFVWETADGNTNVPSTSFPNVTTQRNYRTNILGKLITNPATFNVVIDERFDGDKQYDVEDGDIQYATVEDNTSLQEAIDAATEGTTIIKFAGDIDGTTRAVAAASITVRQKVGVNLVIDGCGHNFDGTFYLEGGNQGGESPETLTFRNINFVHGEGALDFISADDAKNIGKRYAHNVTVDGCTFTGNSTGDVVGMRYRQTYNMTVKNSTFKNMHSAMWATGGTGINVDNVTIEDSKSGVSCGTSTDVVIVNSNFDVNAYGVRTDGNSTSRIAIENTKIAATQPIIVRKMTGNHTVNLNNAELVATGLYHVAFTNGNDDEAYVAPTGNYTIEGADNYNVYPRDEDKDVFYVANSEQLVEALENGKSILLYEDINVTKLDLTALTNDVVIDANGKTIKTHSNYGVQVTAGKNITLKNAKVEMTVEGNYITYAAGFKVENGDYQGNTITLKDCEIRMCNTDWAYTVNMPASVKNLNLVIDGCTLEGAVALQCWGDNNTINITNSNLICNYTTNAMYTSYCVALQGDGTYNSENNTLNISGCAFSYSGVDNYNSTIIAVGNHQYNGANAITVENCTYGEKVKAY